ncbi:uncharacterized protein LOC142972428 [Anticarsia gemmatalis]|uniref:uncharacterized protein LOC142972428 n=1 Tax=Anticarsia gemmatalis TaxID=129554 RepID=UPI003F7734B1
MIIFVTVLYFVASICTARPNAEIDAQNMITVPPNCPEGQQLVNGQCREIWKSVTAVPSNIVTVPTNCPPGQEWVNGQCRDIWRAVTAAPANIVTVPTNCPVGQEYVNGQCRDIWFRAQNGEGDSYQNPLEWPKNTVTVPPNCKPGQQFVNGQCRDIWRIFDSKNMITVPPNCPPGQQLVNGQCRDIWRSHNTVDKFFEELRSIANRVKRQIGTTEELFNTNGSGNRNVINVPNQCIDGYRPDALGNCRPILF